MKYNEFVEYLNTRSVEEYRRRLGSVSLTDDFRLNIAGRVYDFDDIGFRQLCSRVGFPSTYFKKFVEVLGKASTVEIISKFMRKKASDTVYIQVVNGRVSAVRSRIFAPVFHGELISIIERMHGYEPFKNVLNYDGVYRWGYFNKNHTISVDKGDKVYLGFNVKNSEVGHSALVVSPFIYREICSNGAFTTIAEVELCNEIHKGSVSGIIRAFASSIKHIESYFPKVADLMLEFADKRVNVENVLEYIVKTYGFSKSVRDFLVDAYKKEPISETVYGVSNMLSRVSTHASELSDAVRNAIGEVSGALLTDRKLVETVVRL